MNETERRLIKSNITRLRDAIDFDRIIPFLMVKNIFTQRMMDDFEREEDFQRRKELILSDLTRRGPDAYDLFIATLKEFGQREALEILGRDLHSPQVHSESILNPFNIQFRGANISSDLNQLLISNNNITNNMTDSNNKVARPIIHERTPICVTPALTMTIDPDTYTMKSNPRGICVLINNVKFDNDLFQERAGSDNDARNLDEVFKGLGFEVFWRNNLTADQIKSLIDVVSQNKKHWDADAFALIILSHGKKGVIVGSDNNYVRIHKDLIEPFNNAKCPALSGKPKMFFIQACRGQQKDFGIRKSSILQSKPPCDNCSVATTDSIPFADDSIPFADDSIPIPMDSAQNNAMRIPGDISFEIEQIENEPSNNDFIISYSTALGYVSMRNPDYGSWYVTELVNVLATRACDTHLIDILTKVDKEVQKRQTQDGDKQVTSYKTIGWRNKLYFNPGLYEAEGIRNENENN